MQGGEEEEDEKEKRHIWAFFGFSIKTTYACNVYRDFFKRRLFRRASVCIPGRNEKQQVKSSDWFLPAFVMWSKDL